MGNANFDVDSSEIIQTIKDSVDIQVFKDLEDGDFTSEQVHRVPRRAFVPALVIASLTGLVHYLNEKADEALRDGKKYFIQVVSPTEVELHQFVSNEREERFTPIKVKADVPQITFDTFVQRERMMIALQSRFVDTPERAELLENLGNLAREEELLQEDDGVSQRVVKQTGVKRSEVVIKNPIKLQPFRTFTEIEQPESPFIVRLDQDDSEIAVGLFEGDGGAWRNEARTSIKKFLEAELADAIPVLA